MQAVSPYTVTKRCFLLSASTYGGATLGSCVRDLGAPISCWKVVRASVLSVTDTVAGQNKEHNKVHFEFSNVSQLPERAA